MESSIRPSALPALILHQSFALILTWELCYVVLLVRQLFLLWYLLYRQFHLHLFLSLPQLVPFTACYFIWTFSFCLTLPCLSVLDGTSFTHHSIHVQAIVKPSGIYIQATAELCSPCSLPLYEKAYSRAWQVWEKESRDDEKVGQFPCTEWSCR